MESIEILSNSSPTEIGIVIIIIGT